MRYDTSSVNALVLAGGINRIVLFPGYTPGYKALLPVKGRPMIQYTLDALRETDAVKRICIVGPVDSIRNAISHPDDYEYEYNGETLIENIITGMNHYLDSAAVLMVPSDLPLATSQAIGDFLKQCGQIETTYKANILWSMVPEEDFLGPYREVKKGFNRFRDVSVCHGNLLLMTPCLLENTRFKGRMESIYKARKSSARAALAAGPPVGLIYLAGVHLARALTLSGFAACTSAWFGVGLFAVTSHHPEIAVDIDEPRDYDFVCRMGNNE